jgi:hypothetical protein
MGSTRERRPKRGIFRKDAPSNHDAGSGARAHRKETRMRFYQQQHRFYCGALLHARSMYQCILDAAGQALLHRDCPADRQAFLEAVAPYRDGLVVAVVCMFAWYWLADLCAEHGIPFVLGHALYMKAIHQRKSKNDRLDADKIAGVLRGGNIPIAYVYPKVLRETHDLHRRRNDLVRKRAPPWQRAFPQQRLQRQRTALALADSSARHPQLAVVVRSRQRGGWSASQLRAIRRNGAGGAQGFVANMCAGVATYFPLGCKSLCAQDDSSQRRSIRRKGSVWGSAQPSPARRAGSRLAAIKPACQARLLLGLAATKLVERLQRTDLATRGHGASELAGRSVAVGALPLGPG